MSQRNLFLGWGKVTQSLAAVLEGEGIIVDEQSAHGERQAQPALRIGKLSGRSQNPEWIETRAGDFDGFDFGPYLPAPVFLSPGIDCRRPFYKNIAAHEIRELDFFCSRFAGPIIGVTGTDGKSTATFQLGELLRRALPDKRIFVGGNLGHAMSYALLEKPQADLAVIELSSYQCERLKSSRLLAAVILNLDIDHLDRYDSIDDYHRAKWNLLRFASEVFYPHVQPLIDGISKSQAQYSNQAEIEEILRETMKSLASKLKFNLREDFFKDLPRLPHRLEIVDMGGGFTAINDSKATTVHAAIYGLRWAQERFKEVHLILGGRDKGDDFSRFLSVLRPSDRLLLVGEARQKIDGLCQGFPQRRLFASLREALQVWSPMTGSSQSEVCLLLSPACSSFDEFDGFEARGDCFKRELASRFLSKSLELKS